MNGKNIIHAVNVHSGGGKILLNALVKNFRQFGLKIHADCRMKFCSVDNCKLDIKWFRPNFLSRIYSEFVLYRNVESPDIVLFFGNLPPLFRLRGRVVLFIQNRYLIDKSSLKGFKFRVKLRIFIERLWFRFSISHVNEILVQTPTMQKLAISHTGGFVTILPFVDSLPVEPAVTGNLELGTEVNFLYVASGEPHKNHRNLIEAWCLLATEGFFPKLTITLSSSTHSDLTSWIFEKANSSRLNIINVGTIDHIEVCNLYKVVDAIIYPSTFESFGLPLIEASIHNLPILASELDYVRDIVSIAEAFDPHSPTSIARAVKRFIGVRDIPLRLSSPSDFLGYVFKRP